MTIFTKDGFWKCKKGKRDACLLVSFILFAAEVILNTGQSVIFVNTVNHYIYLFTKIKSETHHAHYAFCIYSLITCLKINGTVILACHLYKQSYGSGFKTILQPDGNFLIDGDKKRYGVAELYVDVAGEDSERSVNRRKQILEAQQYVFGDSPNGILTKCRLLGRNMKNAPFTDAQDMLLQEAEKRPMKVIDLYTGQDTGIQLLILDAKEKGILRKVNG